MSEDKNSPAYDPKFETIDKVMEQIRPENRRWCEPTGLGCACKGCVNNDRLFIKGRFQKRHFKAWLYRQNTANLTYYNYNPFYENNTKIRYFQPKDTTSKKELK